MWHIIIKVVDYSKRFFLLEMFFFSRFWLGFIFVRLKTPVLKINYLKTVITECPLLLAFQPVARGHTTGRKILRPATSIRPAFGYRSALGLSASFWSFGHSVVRSFRSVAVDQSLFRLLAERLEIHSRELLAVVLIY